MAYLIQQTLLFTVPLLIVALAGVFAERSGIINIALEGMMIFGGFIGCLFVYLLQKGGASKDYAQLYYIVAMLISAIAGAAYSLLLSFSAVNLKADQTIGGTALNMLAPAIVLFFVTATMHQTYLDLPYGGVSWFILKLSPESTMGDFWRGFFDKAYISTYIIVALFVILSIILYKTKFGLRMRSCGEHPQAAASLGINVAKMRYIGTTISGALAGLGGFVFIITTASGSASGSVGGMGFLALAVMIFGNWKPLYIAGAAILFGVLKALSAAYAYIDINGDGIYALGKLGIPFYLYNMLPYLVTMVVLAFTSKKSRAPKAEGIPYDKSSR